MMRQAKNCKQCRQAHIGPCLKRTNRFLLIFFCYFGVLEPHNNIHPSSRLSTKAKTKNLSWTPYFHPRRPKRRFAFIRDSVMHKINKASVWKLRLERSVVNKGIIPHSDSKQLYVNSAKVSIDNLLKGFNGTIFAYGQTGSGKTHSMYVCHIYICSQSQILQ